MEILRIQNLRTIDLLCVNFEFSFKFKLRKCGSYILFYFEFEEGYMTHTKEGKKNLHYCNIDKR